MNRIHIRRLVSVLGALPAVLVAAIAGASTSFALAGPSARSRCSIRSGVGSLRSLNLAKYQARSMDEDMDMSHVEQAGTYRRVAA
jgi:hypothetical protein